MPTIDERIVSMAFENRVFEQRVATTMTTLSKLDTAIKNIGGTTGFDKIEAQASKVTLNSPMSALDKLKAKLGGASTGAAEGLGGIDKAGNKVTLEGPSQAVDKLQGKMGQLSAGTTFTDIEKASSRVSLEGLTSALDNVTAKFSVLQGAASVALGNIASQAMAKGAAFGKSFAFGPIQQGFQEYQTNLGSIQTILSNTRDSGGNLKSVNAALGELNEYSDKTIYNFSEMAKNIGTFTAAGVQLKPATAAIKGIANLAAMSGSNSQQASTAMYQLSQAIASGKVGLQDWNSVVNAGMGGAVFQKSLMRTAENMGALEKGAVKIDKATGKATVNGSSFRDSIMAKPGQQSWLTSDVLTNTLSQLTGDMSDAELAAKGFDKAQIKAIQSQAKAAQDAATQVKTLPQVFDVAKETIGSGWSKTFQTIFGDFEESKKTFTEMSTFINGFINKMSDARNKILESWKKLGGRDELIGGLKQAFTDITLLLKPVVSAFRNIFPPKTGKDLFDLTKGFHELMVDLRPSPEVMGTIYHAFRAFFAILDIGWNIIKGVAGVIGDLFGMVSKGQGGFVNVVKGISHFIVAIRDALVDGKLLEKFFEGLAEILKLPIKLIGKLAGAIADLFSGGEDSSKLTETVDGVRMAITPAEKLAIRFKEAWEKLVKTFETTKAALEPWFTMFMDKLKGLGDMVANVFKGLDFEKVMQGLQAGALAGIFVTLKKALGGDGVLSGMFDGLKDAMGGVNELIGGFTGQMEAMQSKLKAQALMLIAGAIVVLAAGLWVISTIDGDKLVQSMTAIAVGLGLLMASLKLMTMGMGKLGALQLPFIAAGMIGLAIAVVILAGAMKIFATMSWEDIAKGMVGVAGAVAAIGVSMKTLGGGPSLVLQAAGLILLGVALNLIAIAVGTFADMSWEELVRGLAGVVGSLVGIGAALYLIPPTLPLTAAGLIILGVGLSAIARAVKVFGEMDIFKLVQGIVAITASIAGIGLAMAFIPPTIGLTALGLLVLGQAMVVVAGAVALMGNMGVWTLVKGIIALAATLIVLAAGLTLMIVALPGAAALMVAAGALAVLVPVLGLLGVMKWATIFKGLAAVGIAMVTIGLASIIAAPGLLLLGVALIPLALGFLLVATAVKIFASGIALLASSGQKGFAVFMTALTGFIAIFPTIIIAFLKGLVSIIDSIVVLAPKVVEALGKILTIVYAFLIAQSPKMAIAFGALIVAILKVIGDNAPKIIAAGAKLLQDILTGIDQNVASVVTKVADIIIKFLDALTAKAPDLVEAGKNTLVAFLTGITDKIEEVVSTVATMMKKFLWAVTKEIPGIVKAGQNLMITLIWAIAGFVPRLVIKGTDIIISFLNGIEKAIPKIKTKAVSVARTFLNNLADGLVELTDVGAKALIRFLNGLADSIRKNGPQIRSAGWNIATAILGGIFDGIKGMGGKIMEALKWLARQMPGWMKSVLGIRSPSTVFAEIGHNTMQGLAGGIDKGTVQVDQSMVSAAKTAIDTAQAQFGTVPSMLDGLMDMDPVISPILDLSQVKQEAGKLGSMMPVPTISATASLDQAARISDRRMVQETTEVVQPVVPTSVKFEQNNYSPDPISEIELYRQTNNQLARLKSLVGVT